MLLEATLIFTGLLSGVTNVQSTAETFNTPTVQNVTIEPRQTLQTAERDEEAEWEAMSESFTINVAESSEWKAKEEARKKAEAEKKATEEAAKKAAEEAATTAGETSTTDSSETTFDVPDVTPDPGSAQEEAWKQLQAQGFDKKEFNCLVALWNKESGWRVNAMNSSSGAYGIPQSLPGDKMATEGSDWKTNPATQIKWGIKYIQDRYQTPCNAWGHSEKVNWY